MAFMHSPHHCVWWTLYPDLMRLCIALVVFLLKQKRVLEKNKGKKASVRGGKSKYNNLRRRNQSNPWTLAQSFCNKQRQTDWGYSTHTRSSQLLDWKQGYNPLSQALKDTRSILKLLLGYSSQHTVKFPLNFSSVHYWGFSKNWDLVDLCDLLVEIS